MPDKGMATIQVDIDGQWVLEKLLGIAGEIDPDPVIECGLPRLLKLFDEFSVKATFFVVSRDLESQNKKAYFKDIADHGHEIASHGSTHYYLNGMDPDVARKEVVESKKQIESMLGVKIGGFRAPGFACNRELACLLEEAGYLYDSSVLPTTCGFLMESVAGVSYPKSAMIFAPGVPYRPDRRDIFKKGDAGIVEIPVSVLPFFRVPCHFSYMIIGGSVYEFFVKTMFASFRPKTLNYLFHPLDLVDNSSVSVRGKVPGLKISYLSKLEQARRALDLICRNYKTMTTAELNRSIAG